jgi:signal peptidase II
LLEVIEESLVKNLKRIVLSYLSLLGISGTIVALDQWTKYLVRTNLELGEAWVPFPELAPFLRIVHWRNTGAAFGIFPQASSIFTVIAILVSIAIVYYWSKIPPKQNALRIALALQLAGALGNLISRLTIGIVVDFVAVGNFPVFNVADSSISIGVAILVIATWLEERARIREQSEGEGKKEGEREDRAPEADPMG